MRRPEWGSRVRSSSAVLSTLIALAACGGEGFDPTVDTVSGSYTATVFTLTQSGDTQNLLTAGAILTLTLLDDGTTDGLLFVPGAAEDGSDLDLSLVGTWSLTGNQVTLQHDADTFLRDITLTASSGRLDGEFSSGDEAVHVRLGK